MEMTSNAARSDLLQPCCNVVRVLADVIVFEPGRLRRAARLLTVVLREVKHQYKRVADFRYRRFGFRGGAPDSFRALRVSAASSAMKFHALPDIGIGAGGRRG